MRPNPKQYYICYVLAFISLLGFLSIQLIQTNENVENESNFAIVGKKEKHSIMITPLCSTPNDHVSVPISEIMSGNPIVLPQDDKQIVNYIWSNNLLEPPSEGPYNLTEPLKDPSSGQGQYIRKILKNMKNGFFVECGALDGEARSNTLYMEKELNWKGLLVEADPSNYALVKTKQRKAWTSNSCLAIKPYPHTATFYQGFNVGRIISTETETTSKIKHKPNYVTVQCLPLVSLLAALNVKTVDYFSLDVEGAEYKVLETIPFDKVFIKTLSVEILHTTEGKDQVRKFMESKGYRMTKFVFTQTPGFFSHDYMFVHKDVVIEETD